MCILLMIIYKPFYKKEANSLINWLNEKRIPYSKRIIMNWDTEDIDYERIEIGLREEVWQYVQISLQNQKIWCGFCHKSFIEKDL